MSNSFFETLMKEYNSYEKNYPRLPAFLAQKTEWYYAHFEDLKTKYKKLKKMADKQIVRVEYGTGGTVVRRGWYHPSPIIDLVIGRSSRGKLLKRPTERSKITHKWCFDDQNKLIRTDTFYENATGAPSIEYYIYEENKRIGISYSSYDKHIQILEENFDSGRIQDFLNLSFSKFKIKENGNTEVIKHICGNFERYSYNEKGIDTADIYDFDAEYLFEHDRFYFEHDVEGYLSGFYQQRIKDGQPKDDRKDLPFIPITKKRRV